MPLLSAGGWLWWLYRSDRFEKEPWDLILKTAGLGAAAGVVSLLLSVTVLGDLPHTPLHLVAILGAMNFLAYRSPQWNEPFDGLVYGGAAGIGYGLIYTLPALVIDLSLGYRVAIFSMPIFMMAGVIMGHFMSQAKFGRRFWPWLKGVGIAAVFLFGIEEALVYGGQVVSGSNMLAGLMAYGSNMLAWIFATRAMDLSNASSPLNPEASRLPLAPSGCNACGGAYPAGARYCSQCGHAVPRQREA